jgi:hypothetical protein
MAYKLPPDKVKAALRVEDEIADTIREMLDCADVVSIVTRGSNDPRENGKYGDVLVGKNSREAPLVLIEVKDSTYPGSFSISDYEKRMSQARWVIVKGTLGIWAIQMKVARDFLTEKGTGSDKYWVCEPPWSLHESLDHVIEDIKTQLYV